MKRRWLLGAGCALALLVAGCSGGSSSGSGNGGSGNVSSLPSVTVAKGSQAAGKRGRTTTTTAAPSGPSTTIAFNSSPIKGMTVLSQVGVGNGTSRLFLVPTRASQWDLTLDYSCPGVPPANTLNLANFTYVVYKNGSIDRKDGGGGGSEKDESGTEQYSDSGDFEVHVGAQSACVWSLNAVVPGF